MHGATRFSLHNQVCTCAAQRKGMTTAYPTKVQAGRKK
jgi:hypothetical protein